MCRECGEPLGFADMICPACGASARSEEHTYRPELPRTEIMSRPRQHSGSAPEEPHSDFGKTTINMLSIILPLIGVICGALIGFKVGDSTNRGSFGVVVGIVTAAAFVCIAVVIDLIVKNVSRTAENSERTLLAIEFQNKKINEFLDTYNEDNQINDENAAVFAKMINKLLKINEQQLRAVAGGEVRPSRPKAAEPVKPVKPVKTEEPAETAETAEPVKPAETAEPVKPVESVEAEMTEEMPVQPETVEDDPEDTESFEPAARVDAAYDDVFDAIEAEEEDEEPYEESYEEQTVTEEMTDEEIDELIGDGDDELEEFETEPDEAEEEPEDDGEEDDETVIINCPHCDAELERTLSQLADGVATCDVCSGMFKIEIASEDDEDEDYNDDGFFDGK